MAVEKFDPNDKMELDKSTDTKQEREDSDAEFEIVNPPTI